jgi:hypothetical protein
LGESCIPGLCIPQNSNCKWNGSSFICICFDKYINVNNSQCGIEILDSQQSKCRECLNESLKCIDFNNDGITDECFCPSNEKCEKMNTQWTFIKFEIIFQLFKLIKIQ